MNPSSEVPNNAPSAIPPSFAPLVDERERIDRILERLDISEEPAERADLGSELVRSASRYEDTLERVAWPAATDVDSSELRVLADDRAALREVMVVIEGRTKHLDPRNVHVSDPQGFEDALDGIARQIRALQIIEDAQMLVIDAGFATAEVREQFTRDLEQAMNHASEKPNPPKSALGRTLANIAVKLDRNVEDVSTPQHPGAETTQI